MATDSLFLTPTTFALPHLCVVRAAGADAATFLHNQLTQDVSSLGTTEARLAGYCSVKGRLLASFVVLRPSPEEVLLITPRSGVEALVKRLSMFVMRAKAKLSLADDLVVAGRLSTAPTDTATAAASPWPAQAEAGGWTVQLVTLEGLKRELRIGPVAAADESTHAAAMARWRTLEVRSGVAWVDATTADAFVPQSLNFDALGGINFKKGCYPGQEVVARSQYRGTLKRRAYLLTCDVALTPGQELFCAADPGQPGGQVAMAAPRLGLDGQTVGFDAVAELKVALVGPGAVWHIGTPDGPTATVQPVPYEIPPQD